MIVERPHSPAAPRQFGDLSAAKKSKPFQIMDFLWRRVPLILLVATPLFVLFNLLIAPFSSPVYRVEGSLMLLPNKEPNVSGRDREAIQGDVGYFQRTLGLRLRNRTIMENALKSLPENKRPPFLRGLGESDSAIFRLMGRIKSKEIERTYIMQLSMESDEPEGLAEIMNAVMDSFLESLQTEQQQRHAKRLHYLQDERIKISERAVTEKARLLKIAEKVENRAMLHKAYTAHLANVELLQKLYWEAEAATREKEALLQKAELDGKKLPDLSLIPFAEERVADNFGINQVERWTYEKSQELRSAIDGLTPKNKDRQYVEARMLAMNDYLISYKKTFNENTIRILSDKRKFELDTEIVRARNAYESSKTTSTSLRTDLDHAMQEASRISETIFEAEEVSYGTSQLRDRLAAINTRIDDAELEAKAPLPVIVDQVAVAPSKPISNNLSKLRLVTIVLSFGAVFMGCAVFDFLDGRVRSRAELGAAVGGPGSIPVPLISLSPDNDLPSTISKLPEHPASKAIRDLAIRLQFEIERVGAKLFSLSGVHPGTGNTSLAIALGQALADLGHNVNVVQVPFFPTSGIMETTGCEPCIPRTIGPRMEILPWGEVWSEASVRSQISGFLKDFRSNEPVVVFDVGPILNSDLAHYISAASDCVILTARQDQTLFQDVRKSVEWVQAAGVPAVSVWLNFAVENKTKLWAGKVLDRLLASATHIHRVFDQWVKGRFSQNLVKSKSGDFKGES